MIAFPAFPRIASRPPSFCPTGKHVTSGTRPPATCCTTAGTSSRPAARTGTSTSSTTSASAVPADGQHADGLAVHSSRHRSPCQDCPEGRIAAGRSAAAETWRRTVPRPRRASTNACPRPAAPAPAISTNLPPVPAGPRSHGACPDPAIVPRTAARSRKPRRALGTRPSAGGRTVESRPASDIVHDRRRRRLAIAPANACEPTRLQGHS